MLKKACSSLRDFRLAYDLFNQEEASEAPKCPFMHHGKEVTPAPAAAAKEETASRGMELRLALCARQPIILWQIGLENKTPYDNGSISILTYIFSGLRVRVVLQGADSSEEAGPLVPHLQEGE